MLEIAQCYLELSAVDGKVSVEHDLLIVHALQ